MEVTLVLYTLQDFLGKKKKKPNKINIKVYLQIEHNIKVNGSISTFYTWLTPSVIL